MCVADWLKKELRTEILEVRWKPRAEQELEDILVFTSEWDGRFQTASKLELEVHQKLLLDAENHDIGTCHDLRSSDMRYFGHKRWAVVDDQYEGGIKVLRAVDAAREFSSFWEKPVRAGFVSKQRFKRVKARVGRGSSMLRDAWHEFLASNDDDQASA